HHTCAVWADPLAGRALYPGRDHALAAVVPVPSRQSVLLVADGDGAAFHSVHPQARGLQSAQRPHPRVVYDATRRGAPLFLAPRRTAWLAGQSVLRARSIGPYARSGDSRSPARARHATRGSLDDRTIERRA